MNRRWIAVVAVISVAVNLLLIGSIAGFVLRGPDAGMRGMNPGGMLRELSQEQREALRPQLREKFREGRKLRRELREAQRKLARVVMAEPFDEADALESFQELQQQSLVMQSLMHEEVVMILKQLDQPQRRELLDRILRRGRDRDRGNGGPRGPNPRPPMPPMQDG